MAGDDKLLKNKQDFDRVTQLSSHKTNSTMNQPDKVKVQRQVTIKNTHRHELEEWLERVDL